jgi:hypothetical protein
MDSDEDDYSLSTIDSSDFNISILSHDTYYIETLIHNGILDVVILLV